MATESEQRRILLGVIASAHGVRGQVKLRSFTQVSEDITAYGPLSDKSGRQFSITITGSTNDALIASIEGIATREAAEALRNTELFVPRSALPAPKKNHYYLEDLVGLSLVTEAGETYGTIAAMHNFGAGDLTAVKRVSGEEELLPFTKKIFRDIDFDKASAVIAPPDVVDDE